jgi:hypothetical protein
MVILQSANSVTAVVLANAEYVVDGWYPEGPIDWDDFIDRLVAGTDYDIEDMDSPAVRKIQRHIREYRRS